MAHVSLPLPNISSERNRQCQKWMQYVRLSQMEVFIARIVLVPSPGIHQALINISWYNSIFALKVSSRQKLEYLIVGEQMLTGEKFFHQQLSARVFCCTNRYRCGHRDLQKTEESFVPNKEVVSCSLVMPTNNHYTPNSRYNSAGRDVTMMMLQCEIHSRRYTSWSPN